MPFDVGRSMMFALSLSRASERFMTSRVSKFPMNGTEISIARLFTFRKIPMRPTHTMRSTRGSELLRLPIGEAIKGISAVIAPLRDKKTETKITK